MPRGRYNYEAQTKRLGVIENGCLKDNRFLVFLQIVDAYLCDCFVYQFRGFT